MGAKKTDGQAIAEAQAAVTAVIANPRQVNVRELLDNLRSCSTASARTARTERKKEEDFEKRCYRDVFVQVVGRKPTADEVSHMIGGAPLPKEKKDGGSGRKAQGADA